MWRGRFPSRLKTYNDNATYLPLHVFVFIMDQRVIFFMWSFSTIFKSIYPFIYSIYGEFWNCMSPSFWPKSPLSSELKFGNWHKLETEMEADLKERAVLLQDYQPEVRATLVILDIQYIWRSLGCWINHWNNYWSMALC